MSGKIIRFPTRLSTTEELSFDDALEQLLRSRHRVDRIAAVIDGEERVLLSRTDGVKIQLSRPAP